MKGAAMGQALQQFLQDKAIWQTRYLIPRVRRGVGLSFQGSFWVMWSSVYVTKLFQNHLSQAKSFF
jgi:hypothetical protein